MLDKTLRKNFFSLTILQLGNYLVPLLTLPWLTRVLGADGYGKVGFSVAFIGYFILLVDWGFNLSATRQIAVNRTDIEARSRIFWTVLAAKVLILICSALLLAVCIRLIPGLSEQADLLWLAYMAVPGTALMPVFYFQGIERMAGMASLNLMTRLVAAPLVFLLVVDAGDVAWAVSLQAGSILLAGLLNLGLLFRMKQVCWITPRWPGIGAALADGATLFFSTAAISFYTSSTTVILGFLAGATEVGYFVAAQNIVKAVQGLYGPLSQVVFPRLSHLFQHSRASALLMARKLFWMQGGLTLLTSVVLLFTAPYLIVFLFGPGFTDAISILQYLSPLPFLIGLSNVFGIQIMVPLGYNRAFAGIVTASGVISLLLITALGYRYAADGAAMAVALTELMVTVSMGIFLIRNEPVLLGLRPRHTS